MKKTSVYLSDAERSRLARLARETGASQAEIVRKAIAAYEPEGVGDRNFAGARSFDGPGDSVADHDEDELLAGFGE